MTAGWVYSTDLSTDLSHHTDHNTDNNHHTGHEVDQYHHTGLNIDTPEGNLWTGIVEGITGTTHMIGDVEITPWKGDVEGQMKDRGITMIEVITEITAILVLIDTKDGAIMAIGIPTHKQKHREQEACLLLNVYNVRRVGMTYAASHVTELGTCPTSVLQKTNDWFDHDPE